jgi:hypothetical protein
VALSQQLVDQRPWINHSTITLATKQFKQHKCPGLDGFRPIVLSHLPDKAISALIGIYNAVIQLKYTPRLWRNNNIVFLPKPGKSDYTNRRSFRPISLMPFFFKVLERLTQWHMAAHAAAFHPDQHAFRKGHCTKNALSHMVDTVERAVTR